MWYAILWWLRLLKLMRLKRKMLDHLDVRVRDLSRSIEFYKEILAPLEIALRSQDAFGAIFGDEKNYIWLGEGKVKRIHFAFMANSRAQVEEFWQVGVELGARLHSAPAQQEANYYACYLFDPDGHLIEAVCHEKGDENG
ncbi:VOC family protein [Lactococcus kimchii]|nr:VOC family protein [Lactococcus sp. S-13]